MNRKTGYMFLLILCVFSVLFYPPSAAARQPVACDYVAIDENGTVVQQEHTTVWPGEMGKCNEKWVPLGVAFCNTHSLPAGWKIKWMNDDKMPLLQRQCPAPGESQTYPCAFEYKNAFGQISYQNNGEALTETECLGKWGAAIGNLCSKEPGGTHYTYFNWNNKLVRTEKCPLPTYPCTLSFVSAYNQNLSQETLQKSNQSECLSSWTTAVTNTCQKNPAATHKTTFNNKVVRTGVCPGNKPPPPSVALKDAANISMRAPAGSYKNSCDNCTINIEGKLSCDCKSRSGLKKTSSLDNAGNCSNGVMNLDGQLICEGSFAKSCNECRIVNDRLGCKECKNKKGKWNANKTYSGSWTSCYEGVSNCDGNLTCGACK
jgi:hypothetical protein